MIWSMEIAVAVGATLLTVAIIGVGAWLFVQRQRRLRDFEASMAILGQLATEVKTHNETMAALVTGLTNVSKEQVAQLVELTKATGALHGMFSGDPTRAYQEYDSKAADREWEVQQIMERAGGSREDAEARINERDMWRKVKMG